MSRLLYDLEQAQRLLGPDGNPILARRYLSNAIAQLRCHICHLDINDGRPTEQHFKNRAHTECLETYGGRVLYEKAHGVSP